MKKIGLFLPLAILFVFATACNSQNSKPTAEKQKSDESTAVTAENSSESIHQDVDVQKFKQLIAEEGNFLLDVRTPEEFAEGHIKDAELINYLGDDFETRIAELDKEKTILVYCRSGGRSAKAMEILKTAGFNTVYNLAGGISGWESSGEEVVK